MDINKIEFEDSAIKEPQAMVTIALYNGKVIDREEGPDSGTTRRNILERVKESKETIQNVKDRMDISETKGWAMFQYAYKEGNTVKLGERIALDLYYPEEENIKKMNKISSREDFKFWHNSNKGIAYVERNEKEISEAVVNTFLKLK